MNTPQSQSAASHGQVPATDSNAQKQPPNLGVQIADRVIVALGASIVLGFIGTCVGGPAGAVIGAKLGACLGLGGAGGDSGGSGLA